MQCPPNMEYHALVNLQKLEWEIPNEIFEESNLEAYELKSKLYIYA